MRPLGDDLKVALRILKHQPVGFGKLVEVLHGELPKSQVSAALNVLEDWDMISTEYGDMGTSGSVSEKYSISDWILPTIQSLSAAILEIQNEETL